MKNERRLSAGAGAKRPAGDDAAIGTGLIKDEARPGFSARLKLLVLSLDSAPVGGEAAHARRGVPSPWRFKWCWAWKGVECRLNRATAETS